MATALLNWLDTEVQPISGTPFFTRLLSVVQQEEITRLYEQEPLPHAEIQQKTVLYGVCDQAGQPLLTAADLEQLAGKAGKKLGRLYRAVVEFNRVDDDLDGQVKNSSTGQEKDSS